jgi:hypothetical protein
LASNYLVNEFRPLAISWDPTTYLLLAQKEKALWDAYQIALSEPNFRTKRRGNASWKNLKRWFQLRHDGVENKEVSMEMTETASIKPQKKVMWGMISMVDSMKEKPWDEVEKILELLRAGIISIDAAWGSGE